MMSLKPRNIDFQETWANLKQTVEGVVGLRGVARGEWNARFSDVYALCVAYPEPLADKLYDETRNFLEQHVSGLLERVRGDAFLDSHDPDDGLLTRYVSAWCEYSEGVAYLNNLYAYLNLQHVKRQKISEAEIIYGTGGVSSSGDTESRQLEVGELGLSLWERVLVRPLASALTRRIVCALSVARDATVEPRSAAVLRAAVRSLTQVTSYRTRAPLALYEKIVLTPFLADATTRHATRAAELLDQGLSVYMKKILIGLDREISLCSRFLHASSRDAVRGCYETACVAAHLPALLADAGRLIEEAAADHCPDTQERRMDLHRMFLLVRGLGLQPLVAAARAHVAAAGRAAVAHTGDGETSASDFVQSMLALHGKYSALFAEVFCNNQAFAAALDRACSEVVNSPPNRAPDLLARYCDSLLRKRASGSCESETEERLSAAILVFKYIDDKDVFQKHYARALARRLIHHLSASMEQEEAMINRLKAACGYEFTSKLHRMFTDVAVSADLNAKFQQHLRETGQTLDAGFYIQVLQAGAWPLGAGGGGAPPAPLEAPARLFDTFYRNAFSGRRLAFLPPLCTGELRYRTPKRMYHLSAAATQCALLLAFDTEDELQCRELRSRLELVDDAWSRQLKPIIDAGILIAEGDVMDESENSTAVLKINLNFTSKRSKLRLAPLHSATHSTSQQATSSQSHSTACDDDRKMYLQAALVRIMKQRKVLGHAELVAEAVASARSFAPSVALVKKCIEALIDKQYLERAPGRLDTYTYLA